MLTNTVFAPHIVIDYNSEGSHIVKRMIWRKAAATIAAFAISIGIFLSPPAEAEPVMSPFIHHVYFWLKNPDSENDRAALIAGLRKLASAKTIRAHHIGVPAATSRDVVERSYAVSWMLTFDNKADQDAYQVDPIHLGFVRDCSSLWERVIVYDSEAIDPA